MGIVEFLKEEKFLMEKQFTELNKSHRRGIFEEIGKTNITVLFGLRGTGKTTMIAQKYFETENSIAVHGEHLNLSGFKVKDLISGLKHFSAGFIFIDEITRLANWAEELKVLSDFYPKTKIVVTGSSAVDLQNARRTLARRAIFINTKPLTLNEFLKIKYDSKIVPFNPFSSDPLTSALKTELSARENGLDIEKIMTEFKFMNLPYLMEKPNATLLDVLDRVIYEDIGSIGSFNEDIIRKFWPLLKLLALSEKTGLQIISRDLGVGKGTVIKMIDFLEKANIIRAIYPYVSGKSKIRKEPKYLFSSPAIRSIILSILGEKETDLTREDLFAMHVNELFYLKQGPDFVWNNTLFEIGGQSKNFKQFKEVPFKGKKYIIYDSLEISSEEVSKLPFYIFLSHF